MGMTRHHVSSSNGFPKRRAWTGGLTLGVGGLLLALAPAAWAVNFTWVGGSGNWSTRTNWSPAGVPDEVGDTVTIQTNNNFPFGINLDVQLPAGLAGFRLKDENATLRPTAGLNEINVTSGTVDLLAGTLEAAAGQQLQFGVRNGTINVGDSKILSGPATFALSGTDNTFNAMDGELAVGRTLKIRGTGGPNSDPGRAVLPESLTNRGTIMLDSFFQGGATLVLQDGAGTLVNERDGRITTSQLGGVGGTLRIVGDATNAGVIDLTDQAGGRLEVQGDLTQQRRGTTKLEVAGSDVDLVDNLTVSGVTELAGTLDLSFTDEFVPSVGDSLPILNSSGINGRFELVGSLVEFLDQRIGYRLDYINASAPGTAGTGQVLLTAHNCGDADGDGSPFPDDFDLQEVLTNWNNLIDAGALPDMNGDGLIGIADLNQVLANLTGGTAVPEPANLALLLAVGTAGLRRGRARP